MLALIYIHRARSSNASYVCIYVLKNFVQVDNKQIIRL